MKPRTTIVLIVLLIAGAVYVIARQAGLFRPEPTDRSQENNLFATEIRDAAELTISCRSAETRISFRRRDTTWRIVSPIDARAEEHKVREIIDALKNLRYERRPAPGEVGDDVTSLNLPLWTVTLIGEAGLKNVLHVGNAVPLADGMTYVQPAGEKQTYVVAVDFATKLGRELKEFRDKAVLEFKPGDLAGLSVRGREEYELALHKGRWGIVRPVSAPADEKQVRNLIDKLTSVQAVEFVADKPKKLAPFGLAEPRLTVRLRLKAQEPTPATASAPAETRPAEGKSFGLALGSQSKDNVYAKLLDAPCIFLVPADLLEKLQPKLTDLRDKQVMPVNSADVERVELALPSGDVTLTKQDGQWFMQAPFEGAADSRSVENLLKKINSLQASSLRDDPLAAGSAGLDSPRAKIMVHLAGQGKTATLLLGAKSPSGEMTFVKEAADKSLAVVKTADIAPLLAKPAAYWNPTLLKLPAAARPARIELRRPDGTFSLRRSDAGGWSLTKPLAADAETSAANKIVDSLEDLTATKIVSLGKAAARKYAKAEKIIAVSATTQMPPPASAAATQAATRPAPKPISKTYRLKIAMTDDGSFAWLEGADITAVGRFAPSLYDSFAAELRSRTIWSIKPEDVQAVRIDAGSEKLHLRREKDTWQCPQDTYVRIDAAKVKSWLEDVQNLTAESFASHRRGDAAKFGLDAPAMTVVVADKTTTRTVTVSKTGPKGSKNRYAAATGIEGVFILPGETVKKLTRSLKDFKQ
ncbi:MAG: DUF4340 domain-containing protein [Planctomycetota bacterium]|nr:DUF4340 domain-containing protein [Planctomycetota bacterium]